MNAVVIYDSSGAVWSKDYRAWGIAADGNTFYCSIDADENRETLTDVVLLGDGGLGWDHCNDPGSDPNCESNLASSTDSCP